MVKCTEKEMMNYVSMVITEALLSDLCDRIEAIEELLPPFDMEEKIKVLEMAKGILIKFIEEINCERYKFAERSIVPEDK